MGDNKSTVRYIAEERIEILLGISERFFKGEKPEGVDEALAMKYIGLAMQIMRHYKIKNKDKRFGLICKKCHIMLIPGRTCRVRVLGKSGNIIYKCDKCSTEKRLVFSGSKGKRKSNPIH